MLNHQSRTPDPLPNMNNDCIICNTILRKAGEKGGVHPLHLDRASGNLPGRIETTPTLEQSRALIGEMTRSYCRLVHTQANHHHSAVVQKALTYIDANLSGVLSLRILSGLLQVTPSYLAARFHRETGQTLARHIVQKRMRAARQLLVSTRLQIQMVARLTGFTDPH